MKGNTKQWTKEKTTMTNTNPLWLDTEAATPITKTKSFEAPRLKQ